MLHLEGVQASYGAVKALKGVSLSVKQGEITTVIGANGAGKSTTLRVITGPMSPLAGSVVFEGQPIGGMPPELIASLGIAMVPEGRRLFPDMTVYENSTDGRLYQEGFRRYQAGTQPVLRSLSCARREANSASLNLEWRGAADGGDRSCPDG